MLGQQTKGLYRFNFKRFVTRARRTHSIQPPKKAEENYSVLIKRTHLNTLVRMLAASLLLCDYACSRFLHFIMDSSVGLIDWSQSLLIKVCLCVDKDALPCSAMPIDLISSVSVCHLHSERQASLHRFRFMQRPLRRVGYLELELPSWLCNESRLNANKSHTMATPLSGYQLVLSA